MISSDLKKRPEPSVTGQGAEVAPAGPEVGFLRADKAQALPTPLQHGMRPGRGGGSPSPGPAGQRALHVRAPGEHVVSGASPAARWALRAGAGHLSTRAGAHRLLWASADPCPSLLHVCQTTLMPPKAGPPTMTKTQCCPLRPLPPAFPQPIEIQCITVTTPKCTIHWRLVQSPCATFTSASF